VNYVRTQIALMPFIAEQHRTVAPSQHERGTQSGGSPADNEDIELHWDPFSIPDACKIAKRPAEVQSHRINTNTMRAVPPSNVDRCRNGGLRGDNSTAPKPIGKDGGPEWPTPSDPRAAPNVPEPAAALTVGSLLLLWEDFHDGHQ
jgi:hypothetical protein